MCRVIKSSDLYASGVDVRSGSGIDGVGWRDWDSMSEARVTQLIEEVSKPKTLTPAKREVKKQVLLSGGIRK